MKPASQSAPAPSVPPAAPRARWVSALTPFWDAITSLRLTIVCLSALMVLVVACTLAQVRLGTWGAVELYMRSWIVWWEASDRISVPVFPGGAFTGLVLIVNLVAAQLRRLELSWKKSGLWLVHLGLILLVAGEFVSAVYQREHRLLFENGQTVNYVTSPTLSELAVIDRSDPRHDEVFSFPQSMLRPGKLVQVPGRRIAFRVKEFHANSEVGTVDRGMGMASAGLGPELVARGIPRTSRDDERNMPTVVLERVGAKAGSGTPETWLLSAWLNQSQRFVHEGRTYDLVVRSEREYLPYALTLKKFSHDRYAGTNIPKNFSSAVRLTNPRTGEARDVLIKMNQPLRYSGKTFYQASFQGETVSILQVVENPGWLLPYVSCLLVAAGLVAHFGISLRRWVRGQSTRRTARALETTP